MIFGYYVLPKWPTDDGRYMLQYIYIYTRTRTHTHIYIHIHIQGEHNVFP